MAIFNLYSKRNSKDPNIYCYNEIPYNLRVQIKYIIQDFLNKNRFRDDTKRNFWTDIYEVLTREHGKVVLIEPGFQRFNDDGHKHSIQVQDYLLYEKDINKVIDAIEVSFQFIQDIWDIDVLRKDINEYSIKEAISDLNTRFKQNGVGYKFENNIIIKFDNELLHSTITKPVLAFLTNPDFKPINDEFLKAHEHFRHNDLHACINECLKAFESTMKIICDKKGFAYKQKDTSSTLIGILYTEKYIPLYLQNYVSGLRSTLEGGITAIRNTLTAHGKGVAVNTANEELASFTLNLTGSTIKFLLELIDK